LYSNSKWNSLYSFESTLYVPDGGYPEGRETYTPYHRVIKFSCSDETPYQTQLACVIFP